MRTNLLNQPIDVISKNEAALSVRSALLEGKQLRIITLNPEMIVTAMKNIEFQYALKNSDFIVADGTGIVWALKLNGFEKAERIPGIELAEEALEIANELKKRVAILGSTETVIQKTVINLKEKYKSLEIVYSQSGFFSRERESEIADLMSKSSPDIVLIALGSPKQELWINKYSTLFPKSILIGIGGSLDVWSGKKQRAPKLLRDIHLEWFYRIINEPERVPRVLKSLPKFIYMVIKSKIMG